MTAPAPAAASRIGLALGQPSRNVYFVIAGLNVARVTEAWRAALGAALGPIPVVVFETTDAAAQRLQSPLAERARATLIAFGHRVEPVACVSAALAAYRDERKPAMPRGPGATPEALPTHDIVEVWQ